MKEIVCNYELSFFFFFQQMAELRIKFSDVLSGYGVKFTAKKQAEMQCAEEKEAKFSILTLWCGNILLESDNLNHDSFPVLNGNPSEICVTLLNSAINAASGSRAWGEANCCGIAAQWQSLRNEKFSS